MLQQTQVTTVIPYYLRFIEAFPDVRTLAAASEDDVLRHWAGLGYYARGRNLLACAKAVMASGGEFPKNREALEALPGIGRSTAAAILSSCWDMPEAILDGNAKRVFARYFGVKRGESETLYQKRLWEIAEETVPQKECGIYTQALMDLGSMVCRRSRPDCGSCPLRDGCKGFASGDPSAFPGVKKRAEKPVRSSSFLVIRSESRLWVVRREMKGCGRGFTVSRKRLTKKRLPIRPLFSRRGPRYGCRSDTRDGCLMNLPTTGLKCISGKEMRCRTLCGILPAESGSVSGTRTQRRCLPPSSNLSRRDSRGS